MKSMVYEKKTGNHIVTIKNVAKVKIDVNTILYIKHLETPIEFSREFYRVVTRG